MLRHIRSCLKVWQIVQNILVLFRVTGSVGVFSFSYIEYKSPVLLSSQAQIQAFILSSFKVSCIILVVQDGGDFPASGPHSGPFILSLSEFRITVNLKGKVLESPHLPKAFFCILLHTFSQVNRTYYHWQGYFYQVKNRVCSVPSLFASITLLRSITHVILPRTKQVMPRCIALFCLDKKKPPAIFKWQTLNLNICSA